MKDSFFGGANEVGASCTLIEIEDERIQVDAGRRMNVKQDKQLPDLDKIGKVDAFLLTHAHTDHTGALPEIVRRWPGVKGYCTPATRDLTRKLLEDSRKQLKRKKQRVEKPCTLTDIDRELQDIDQALQYLKDMKEVQWREPEQICGNIKATWTPAGHILGAAMIYIEGERESILMTGDVSVTKQKTIPGMSMSESDLPYRLDVMVMESTYGNNPPHKDRAEEGRRLISKVVQVIEAGGKVLIPVFAIGRAQEVILILKDAMQREEIPKFPVWIDGMVKDINKVYSDYSRELSLPLQRKAERDEDLFYSNSIEEVSSQDERDSILAGPPCCIVASSGMLIGGCSSYYAKHLAPHSKNLIAITGYQAEGTPGRALEDLKTAEGFAEEVWKLDDGASVLAGCQVERYSLSAHADRDQLTELVKTVQPRKLFLVHGDRDARKKLAASVRRQVPEVEVKLPKNGSTYTVEKHPGIAEGRSHDHSKVLAGLYDFVLRMGLKGPFSARQLTEMYFATAATTSIAVDFLQLCLWLDSQFFKRESDGRFSPRQSCLNPVNLKKCSDKNRRGTSLFSDKSNLSKQFLNNIPVVHHPNRPPTSGIILVFRINAKRVAKRRKQIRDRNGSIYNLQSIFTRGTNHLSAANPTSPKHHRPTVGKMIASIVIVNFGSPSKLTNPQDNGFVQ